jgi:predicted enzyme related to lactoylglutathione lyase
MTNVLGQISKLSHFECDDTLATYEELKAKGVKFTKEPTKEFYGFNAVFADDSGNWFSLSEAKKV